MTWSTDSEEPVLLKLYVTGNSQRSSRAIEAVRAICRDYLQNRVTLEIVDVLEQPEDAENERIIATPTLIRKAPGPHRRLVGDLGETERIIRLLGFWDMGQPEEQK